MTTIGTSTNTPTCPDWCELEQHHDYDSITNDGRLLRHHATKARVNAPLGMDVDVTQTEYGDGGRGAVFIGCYAEGADLTPADARDLAVKLVDAAALVESLR